MNYAAILASGVGSRMGAAIPKQFLCIDGEPIIIKSLKAFIASGSIDGYIIAVSNDWLTYCKEQVAKFCPDCEVFYCIGGSSRNETMLNIIAFLNDELKLKYDDIVLTHDAVRPFINSEIINSNIEAAKLWGAANTVIPAVDSMILSEDGEFTSQSLPRSEVFHVQTPQSFQFGQLSEVYQSLSAEAQASITDAAAAFTLLGKKVKLVQGSAQNIKITFPADLNHSTSKGCS